MLFVPIKLNFFRSLNNFTINSNLRITITSKINNQFFISALLLPNYWRKNSNITILSPIIRQKKGTYEKLIVDLASDGYSKVRVNGKIIETSEKVKLDRYKKHDIEVVIDALDVTDKTRLSEAIESAVKKGEGLVIVMDDKEKTHLYSS